jgi:hypothetical protein
MRVFAVLFFCLFLFSAVASYTISAPRSCACGCSLSPSSPPIQRAQFIGWSSLGHSSCSPSPVSSECDSECRSLPGASLCNPNGIVSSCLYAAPNPANVTKNGISYNFVCFCNVNNDETNPRFLGLLGNYWTTVDTCNTACQNEFKYPNPWNSTSSDDQINGYLAGFQQLNQLLATGQRIELDLTQQSITVEWPTEIYLDVYGFDTRPIWFNSDNGSQNQACSQKSIPGGLTLNSCPVQMLTEKSKSYMVALGYQFMESIDDTSNDYFINVQAPSMMSKINQRQPIRISETRNN